MPVDVPAPVRAAAADLFGLDPDELRGLHGDGAPDAVVLTADRDGMDVFLKIKPITPDAVDRELDRISVVGHLGRHVRVPRNLPSRRGELLEVVQGPDALFAVTLTERAQGRHVQVSRDWTAELVTAWGRTLGRMHAAMRGYDGAPALPDWRAEHASFARQCQDVALGRVWDELGAQLAELPTGEDVYGIIHNDLHLQNLLVDDGGALTVLDFDVCSRHWFATDLAIVLVHPIWELRTRAPHTVQGFVDTVVDGYLADFPEGVHSFEFVPLLMRYRMALIIQAVTAEHGGQTPTWMHGMRDWVLSGEPLTDATL